MLSLGRDDDPVFPSRRHGWRLTRIVPLPLLHPVRNVLVGSAACRCERSEDRTDEPEDGGPARRARGRGRRGGGGGGAGAGGRRGWAGCPSRGRLPPAPPPPPAPRPPPP